MAIGGAKETSVQPECERGCIQDPPPPHLIRDQTTFNPSAHQSNTLQVCLLGVLGVTNSRKESERMKRKKRGCEKITDEEPIKIYFPSPRCAGVERVHETVNTLLLRDSKTFDQWSKWKPDKISLKTKWRFAWPNEPGNNVFYIEPEVQMTQPKMYWGERGRRIQKVVNLLLS